jgi:uncharacterized membrane protein
LIANGEMNSQKVKNARSSLFGSAGKEEKEKHPARSQQPSQDKQQQYQQQQEDAVEKDMQDYTNSLRRTVTTLKDVGLFD